MSGSDQSYNDQGESDEWSDEDVRLKKQLRMRDKKNFNQGEEKIKRQTRVSRGAGTKTMAEEPLDDEEEEDQQEEEEQVEEDEEIEEEENLQKGGVQQEVGGEGDEETVNEIGVFFPDLDQILWRREKESNPKQFEYLVKYKDYSYLHLEWITEEEIVSDSKGGRNKLKRFNKNFERKIAEGDYDPDLVERGQYFDPTYIEVDRIIHTTELFPVIHPKKAQDIRNKWTEPLVTVVSKLLNFSKEDVHYGVYFSQPVNPELDNCPNYRKIITYPMDLGTIINRLYLDYYKSSEQLWKDLGYVFKNCRKYNKDSTSEIRQLGDTLREAAIVMYEQWHREALVKYQSMLQKFYADNPERAPQQQSSSSQQHNFIKEEVETKQEEQLQKQFDTQLDIKKEDNNTPVKTEELASIQSHLVEQIYTKSTGSSEQVQHISQKFFEFQKQNGKSSQDKDYKDQIVDFIKQNPQLAQHYKQQQQQRSTNGASSNNPLDELQQFKYEDKRKKKTEASLEDVELFNPGEFTFDWLQDENSKLDVLHEDTYHNWNYLIEDKLISGLDLNKEVDRLYMVKWKNLSYSEATWEHESQLVEYLHKINDFKQFNRALDKESRAVQIRNYNIHKTLLDLEQNPRKKSKFTHHQLLEMKNKLYHYEVAQKKQPLQYKDTTQLIFKGGSILRQYQLDSLNWLIQSWYLKRNVILADEMGLGKTIQSVAFLNHLHSFEQCRGPFLIIAPLSTLDHWKRTGEDWTNLNTILYYDGNSQIGREHCRNFEWLYTDISTKGSVLQTTELFKFSILITSYEVFMSDLEKVLIHIPFQFIVVDEAHKLKNQNAKILQSLKKLPCKRYLLLTGTPIQNSTEELFSLLNFIEPLRFGSIDEFKSQFGELSTKEQVDELQRQIKPYMLRRVKNDVENSIPPLQETIIDIEMTTIQKTLYRGLYERNKNILQKNFSMMASVNTSLNNLEMQLRKCCNHPFLIKEFEHDMTKDLQSDQERYEKLINSSGKMILLDKLVHKFLKERKKMLIFSQFTYVLVLLEEYLRHHNIRYEKIDGGVKCRDRQNAIDRFNKPDLSRDVFLLSTKAGGLGINLTAANVVIIYDSDWNPQNDVQATARAHRIGQKQEVTVYRFITKNTYESQMFERATRKLGQAQAVYGDGEFKQAGERDENEDKKPSKKEVEALLKKGILSFIEDQGGDNKPMFEENIDDILQHRTRVATHNLISGNCSFNKTSFVSNQTDQNIDINDPNFWTKVLPQESQTAKIRKDLEKNLKKIAASADQQRTFVSTLQEQVRLLVESKIKVELFNLDDQTNLNYCLTLISSTKGFSDEYRKAAEEWISEIDRPSRRFKIMNFGDAKKNITNNYATNHERNNGKGNDAEHIFQGDSDEESQEGLKEELVQEKVKGKGTVLATRNYEDLLKKLCYYCESPNCTYFCAGNCKRSFHSKCKAKVEGGWVNVDGPDEDLKPEELSKGVEQLKNLINDKYTCNDCKDSVQVCFLCKKKGKYYGYEPSKKKKPGSSANNAANIAKKESAAKEESGEEDELQLSGEKGGEGEGEEVVVEEEEEQEPQLETKQKETPKAVETTKDNGKPKNDLIKCSTANCNKFYHLECCRTQPLFRYIDSNHTRFRCSLHYCQKCSVSGDSMAIAQCVRCHRSYHLKCQDKDKTVKLAKKLIICQEHTKKPLFVPKDIADDNDDYEGEKIQKKRNTGSSSGNAAVVVTKTQIASSNNNGTTSATKETKETNGRVTRGKEQTKIDSYFSTNNNGVSTRKDRKRNEKETAQHKNLQKALHSEEDEEDYSEDEEEEEVNFQVPKKTNEKPQVVAASSGSKKGPGRAPIGVREPPKYSFADFGIVPIQEFKYELYSRDWCRYCGSRFSSNFTKGPWGPRTLCTVHYISWQQKKTLSLSQYPTLPSKPINPNAESGELTFLSDKKKKNPDYDPIDPERSNLSEGEIYLLKHNQFKPGEMDEEVPNK